MSYLNNRWKDVEVLLLCFSQNLGRYRRHCFFFVLKEFRRILGAPSIFFTIWKNFWKPLCSIFGRVWRNLRGPTVFFIQFIKECQRSLLMCCHWKGLEESWGMFIFYNVKNFWNHLNLSNIFGKIWKNFRNLWCFAFKRVWKNLGVLDFFFW